MASIQHQHQQQQQQQQQPAGPGSVGGGFRLPAHRPPPSPQAFHGAAAAVAPGGGPGGIGGGAVGVGLRGPPMQTGAPHLQQQQQQQQQQQPPYVGGPIASRPPPPQFAGPATASMARPANQPPLQHVQSGFVPGQPAQPGLPSGARPPPGAPPSAIRPHPGGPVAGSHPQQGLPASNASGARPLGPSPIAGPGPTGRPQTPGGGLPSPLANPNAFVPGTNSAPAGLPTGGAPQPSGSLNEVQQQFSQMGINGAYRPPAPSTTQRAKRVYATDPSLQQPAQYGVAPPVPGQPSHSSDPAYGNQGARFGQPPAPQTSRGSTPQPGFMPPMPGAPQPMPSGAGPQPPTFNPQMQQQGYGIPNDHQYQRAPTAQYGNPGAPNGQQFGKPAAPRSRIDPNQIPSPLLVQEKDQLMHETNFFSTFSREMPPLASSRFSAVDEGNCNPRFMRLTTYQIPCTDELLTSSMLPLGAVIQPFADLAVTERPLDVVDFGESGPVRCRRCKSYVNPYYQFIDGGRKFVCNLCSADTEVPGEYFCNLDMSGRRMDVGSRPELLRGAVEFKASKEYSSRPATPPSFVFAIDVSYTSMQSGMAAKAAEGLKQLLYGSGKGLPPKAKIGIITFDKAIHFYNMMPMLDQPHMLVVPDVNDIFVPLNEGFLVDPQESRTVIESFLNNLPNLFEGNLTRESAVGAAAQAAYMAMEKQGGHLYIFQTTLPNFGPGALKMREDPSLYGTDKERTLFEPQEFFWRKLGQDCSKDGVCVDLFLFRHSYIDVATLGSLSAITGGDTTYYENFMAERDGIRFIEDLKRSASRSFGFDALMRIRCSDGLKVSHYFGNFHMRNSTDIELAGIDSQKTFAVSFKHDGKLDEKTDTSIQVALLYTSSDGDRRIRVLNLVVPNTTSLGNVFRSADMDTTMNYLAKASVSQAATTLLKTVREQLTDRCVKILTAYRKHCASSSSPGQLILPESFKLYPLYSLSLLKCKAFRGGPDITSDARVFHMRMMKNIPVAGSIALFYPRMVALHNLAPNVGVVENGSVRLPPSVRVSFERLELNGIYIVENGIQMYCWIGRGVLPEVLLKIFGVDKVEAVDPKLLRIPVLDNEYSTRVHAILNQIQADRPNYLPLKLVRYQMDTHLDVEFANFLVEDQNYDSMNYVDYLCFVHRNIQVELTS